MLVINAIAIINIAVIFLLLTRFSQKVHLLYPRLWTVQRVNVKVCKRRFSDYYTSDYLCAKL